MILRKALNQIAKILNHYDRVMPVSIQRLHPSARNNLALGLQIKRATEQLFNLLLLAVIKKN
jgi:hypothetical protein